MEPASERARSCRRGSERSCKGPLAAIEPGWAASRSWRPHCGPLHFARKGEVESADAAGVMRRQIHEDPIVDIEPLGVMVLLFCHEGTSRHEAKRLHEIAELVLPVQFTLSNCPAGQSLETGFHVLIAQLGDLGARAQRRLCAGPIGSGGPRRGVAR